MLQFIINYWIEIFFTIITSMVVAIYKYVKYKFKEQDIIKEGVQAILHDRLYQCGRYYIDRGHITLEELNNV